MTGGQHAAALKASGRELGAALAAAAGEDGTAGARAHAQAEAVRLGATAVVRLEGALAHEDLRLLASARRGESVEHPVVGFGCGLRRPQSAGPWRSGRRRHRTESEEHTSFGAMGMRKRSQTRSVNDTGAVEDRSNQHGPTPNGGARQRTQVDTPTLSRSVDDPVVGPCRSC